MKKKEVDPETKKKQQAEAAAKKALKKVIHTEDEMYQPELFGDAGWE